MLRILSLLCLAATGLLTSCSAATSPSTPPVNPMFDAYIELQTALAADSRDAARKAAGRLASESSGKLQALAQVVALREGISDQRYAFAALSVAIIDAGAVPEGLYAGPLSNGVRQ